MGPLFYLAPEGKGEMAGTVTTTRESDFNGPKPEVKWTLDILSDAAGAADTTIAGMKGWKLAEVQTVPDSGGTQPDADYTGSITDADGGELLEIPARSQTAKEYIGGHETLGYSPRIDGTITITMAAMGNAKGTTMMIRFEQEAA